jgi:vacuolar-type H+-ATPase subunit I/STV1
MDIEENKMKISDTPRTDDAEYLSYDSEPPESLEMVDVGFARQLEIELNTAIANEAFAENKAHMLEKELKQTQDRIKERDEWNKKLDEIIDRKTEKIIFLSEIRQEAGVQDANLREKLSAAHERIKRLEDVLQTAWYLIANVDWETGKHSRLHKDFLDWRDKGFHAVMLKRAKEDKP